LAKVVCPTPAQQVVFQEGVRAVDEQVDRLARIEAELQELAPRWSRYSVVEALQAAHRCLRRPEYPAGAFISRFAKSFKVLRLILEREGD
jgi:hypothetical protein